MHEVAFPELDQVHIQSKGKAGMRVFSLTVMHKNEVTALTFRATRLNLPFTANTMALRLKCGHSTDTSVA